MKKKIDAVKSYLSRQFTGRYIEHQADFDGNAQCFRVHLEEGTLVLKLSDEVLRGNSPSAVRTLLEEQGVGGHLWRLKGSGRGLLLGSAGHSEFPLL